MQPQTFLHLIRLWKFRAWPLLLMVSPNSNSDQTLGWAEDEIAGTVQERDAWFETSDAISGK